MSNTLFTSDSHWNHFNIIKYCKRPFATVEEMNEALIDKWNKKVGPKDTVYHLGDFAFHGNHLEVESIASRLNGKIHLIIGNHDTAIVQIAASHKRPFIGCDRLIEHRINDQKIVMCHYALRTWRHDLRGTWMIYGHSHGGLPAFGKSCDVGVDSWNFEPVHFDELKSFMDKRDIGKHPKFDGYIPGEQDENQQVQSK